MDRKHFKCLFWKGLWALGALSFVGAVYALYMGPVLGFDAQYWFWGALILTALSIPIKLDCHSCSVCETR